MRGFLGRIIWIESILVYFYSRSKPDLYIYLANFISFSIRKVVLIQGVCRQSAKAKLKNRHFTGAIGAQNLFSSLYKLGSNFLWIREV